MASKAYCSEFKTDTLNTCKRILEARKKQMLKYANVVLPTAVSSDKGFHIQCYRQFIVLFKAQRIDDGAMRFTNEYHNLQYVL